MIPSAFHRLRSWSCLVIIGFGLWQAPLTGQTPSGASPEPSSPSMAPAGPASSELPALSIAADSSLKGALTEIVQAWADAQGDAAPKVALILANAGTLREKAAQGASWDLVISSDLNDINQLINSGILDPNHRATLAQNSLVILGRHPLIKDDDLDWTDLMGREWKKVALGNPDLVGSGRSARILLQKHDFWDDDNRKNYLFSNSEAGVLQTAMSGNTDACLVYKTDLYDQVFPGFEVYSLGGDAPPVYYGAAGVRVSLHLAAVDSFLKFATGPESRPVWIKYQFEAP